MALMAAIDSITAVLIIVAEMVITSSIVAGWFCATLAGARRPALAAAFFSWSCSCALARGTAQRPSTKASAVLAIKVVFVVVVIVMQPPSKSKTAGGG